MPRPAWRIWMNCSPPRLRRGCPQFQVAGQVQYAVIGKYCPFCRSCLNSWDCRSSNSRIRAGYECRRSAACGSCQYFGYRKCSASKLFILSNSSCARADSGKISHTPHPLRGFLTFRAAKVGQSGGFWAGYGVGGRSVGQGGPAWSGAVDVGAR